MEVFIVEKKVLEVFSFRESVVEFLKMNLAIRPLQFFYRSSAEKTLLKLESLPENTIGRELFQMLRDNNLKVIPKFETHDLKHLILGYGMTSIEEIKMQAYLFGNGNKSIFCLLFLASGLLFPENWSEFIAEFKNGKRSVSIDNLSFEDVLICRVMS